jgi:hypothetical protein
MSKRTPRNESSEPPSPSPRRRKAADTAEPAAAAPKVTRTRRKASEPVQASAPSNGNGHSHPTDLASDPLAGFDAATPSYEQIATRAYFIALERGFQTDPLSDWLLAERELRGVSVRS